MTCEVFNREILLIKLTIVRGNDDEGIVSDDELAGFIVGHVESEKQCEWNM